MKTTLSNHLARHRVAALFIAGVAIAGCSHSSSSTRATTAPVSRDREPGTSQSFGATSASPTSTTTTKAGEEPMFGAQANVSNVSVINTGSGEVEISGSASAGAKVTVNGEPVAVRSDGSWSVHMRTGRGATAVNVVAVSADGSSRSSSSVTVSG